MAGPSHVVAALLVLCLVSTVLSRPISSMKVGRHPHKFTDGAASMDMLESAQHATSSRWRAGSTVILKGGLLTLGTYYCTITIGTPPVAYNVLLDTGSSNIAVSSSDCSNCGPPAPRYNPNASSTGSTIAFGSPACSVCNPNGSTTACTFGQPYRNAMKPKLCGNGISYGGGSSFVSGYLASDVVSFGGFNLTTEFLALTHEVPAAALTESPLNGILGMAHENNAVNPTWVPTIYRNIVEKFSVPDLFGLCLTNSQGGVLDLGHVDETKFSGSLQWVKQTQERWYNMAMLDVAVGTTSIGLPSAVYSYLNDQIGTFIDSGTSAILFGPAIYSHVKQVFQTQHCDLPGVCSSSNIFNGACVSEADMKDQLSSFPDLQFTFANAQAGGANVVLRVASSHYFLHTKGRYCLAVSSVAGISAVLGDPFMEPWYIVHDRANRRIGFAPITSCA